MNSVAGNLSSYSKSQLCACVLVCIHLYVDACRVGQNRVLESSIGYFTVYYPYNTYHPRIPYVSEKWNPSELNDKGVIVQLLKS